MALIWWLGRWASGRSLAILSYLRLNQRHLPETPSVVDTGYTGRDQPAINSVHPNLQ